MLGREGKVETLHVVEDTVDEQASFKPEFTAVEACWVCGGKDLEKLVQDFLDFSDYAEQDRELSEYKDVKFWLMRCRDCGFIQPDSLPSLDNFFERMYDQRWSDEWVEQEFHNGCKDFIFQRVLGQLRRRSPARERRLLDIGAHVGRLMHLAREAGWQAEGVEFNPRTSSFAARQTGLPVHQVNAQKLVAEGRHYDVVTMIDVLEHIENPVDMLRSVRQLLDDDGWLAVKVPCGPNQILKERLRARVRKNYRFSVASNLVHVNHFSPASLRLALEKAGFSDIEILIGAPELSPQNTSTKLRGIGQNALRLGVYYFGRVLPAGVHTPLALNLQAYARKA